MLVKRCYLLAVVVVLLSTASSWGQQKKSDGNPSPPGVAGRGALPAVSELIQRFDKNGDGALTKEEVTDAMFRQNFDRWDADGDGSATAAEITEFRRRAGIAVPGNSNERNDAPLTVPKLSQLLRIDRATRPDPEARRNSEFILKTSRHVVEGDRYVVLSDHTEPEYLQPLERLATHYDGLIVRVDDLAALHKDKSGFAKVRQQLRDAKVRYLAIAPRMETYRENMLLGVWELISTIDDDPQLDAYPGIIVASSAERFTALIDRSIQHVPASPREFRPFAISQVPSTSELRSLQKAAILREWFAGYDYQTPTVAVYSPAAKRAPRLDGKLFWAYDAKGPRDFLTKIPEAAASEFNTASLLVLHGHGIPGMSCGVDIAAIPSDLSAQIVLVGSCFSAAPQKSDLPAMQEAPGGYRVEARDAFAIRAVDRGAKVVFGHMRLSQGFPHLFPVLESLLEGSTVGEAYQELMNAIIDFQGVKVGKFAVGEGTTSDDRQSKDNLLYVIIGDPAIHPLERIKPK